MCVWIPLFPLRCEEQRRPELAHRPTVLLSADDTRRVWLISPSSRRAGVRAGMTVSQAIGLCPMLTVLEPDPVHYDEQFTRLLVALETVSPAIEPAELGRAYVGVDGLERLYGAPEQVLGAIAECGLRIGAASHRHAPQPTNGHNPQSALRLGWGRGKFTAWVAATRAKPGSPVIVRGGERAAFLADQPVAVLPVTPDTHRRLYQLGIRTLRDLARLPETAMVSQFGREGRHAWRLAAGQIADPVVGRERPEPIVAAFDLAAPVADRAMLTHAIRKLVERALRHPQRTGWRVQVVRLQAGLEYGASWTAQATLKDPSADSGRIAAPLEAKLEQSPPTGAVERLVVEFTEFARGTVELQLFARDAAAAARVGRVRALRTAAREIETRFKRKLLCHVIEVQPWSRIPERRYALIDFEY